MTTDTKTKVDFHLRSASGYTLMTASDEAKLRQWAKDRKISTSARIVKKSVTEEDLGVALA